MQTTVLKVMPARANSGITLNGVLACPNNIVRGDTCVVLRKQNNYAFTVEHPLAALRMCGIHDAAVEGIEEAWDFARPQHRAAYSLGLRPLAVLGGPDGTISGRLIELINDVGISDSGAERQESTVTESILTTTEDGGKLEIEPARKGTGLSVELYLGGLGPVRAKFDPEIGLVPEDLKTRVGRSVTGFIRGPSEESLYHALGDLIGDLAGVGGIDDAVIKARFMRYYHRLTMNAARSLKLTPAF